MCIAHDAHPLSMDAPSWGDTGGHTGAAPTSLHQTPLLPIISCFCPSAEPLPAIIFNFVHRWSLFRQPFLDLVHRQSLFRQPFLVFVHRQSLFRQSFLVLVRRRSLFRQPWDTEPHEEWVGAVPMCPSESPHKGAFVVHSPHTMRVFFVWKHPCADVRAGT